MFITRAELARWWTKGVANFRFRKQILYSDHIFEITKTLSWFYSQYDGPASCVPYTQCDPFSMMLTNLRKPFPLVSYRSLNIQVLPMLIQFTTSSRRLDGGAYCGAPVGGK